MGLGVEARTSRRRRETASVQKIETREALSKMPTSERQRTAAMQMESPNFHNFICNCKSKEGVIAAFRGRKLPNGSRGKPLSRRHMHRTKDTVADDNIPRCRLLQGLAPLSTRQRHSLPSSAIMEGKLVGLLCIKSIREPFSRIDCSAAIYGAEGEGNCCNSTTLSPPAPLMPNKGFPGTNCGNGLHAVSVEDCLSMAILRPMH